MFPPIVGIMTMTMSKAAHFSWSSGSLFRCESFPNCAMVGRVALLLGSQWAWAWVVALIFLVLVSRSAWSLGPTGKGVGYGGTTHGWCTRCIISYMKYKLKSLQTASLKCGCLKDTKIFGSNVINSSAKIIPPQRVPHFPTQIILVIYLKKQRKRKMSIYQLFCPYLQSLIWLNDNRTFVFMTSCFLCWHPFL